MFRKLKNVIAILVLLSIVPVLSACGSKFTEGDPYYYVLQQIGGNNYQSDAQLYIVDPFEGKVIVSAEAIEFDDLPDLEEYEDTAKSLFFKFSDGKTERFEKKSDSLWVSLETGVEYDAKRKEGEFDYTPVEYELPWEENYGASDYLSGQTFTKYAGDGAERLLFVEDDKLIVSIEGTLPPFIADLDGFADYGGNETIEFENIELTDGESGEFLVIYEGKELLKLVINEDYLLETEDGTTYMRD